MVSGQFQDGDDPRGPSDHSSLTPTNPEPGWLPNLGFGRRRWRQDAKSDQPIPPPKRSYTQVYVDAAGSQIRRPRILFINQYYWPDHASTAQHLTDLCESLANHGFDVHVLCSRGGYVGGGNSKERLPREEERNGVQIHRVWATALGRRNVWSRMTDYLTYYAGATIKGLWMSRFDVVVNLTTPPIIGLAGIANKWMKRSKSVYWSMDLHPDASFELGKMSPKSIHGRILGWLSNAVYRGAHKVVTLGPYMTNRIQAKRVPENRIVEIPVWSRHDEIYPLPREGHPLRRELGLEDKFIVMYSGNLGLAHTFDEFLDAAQRLKDLGRTDVVFLFVGGGPRLAEVRRAKTEHQLDNILIMDYFPREQLHISLSLADLHLISMRPEMTGVVVPGKLYGIMASSRPALFVGPLRCESADTIRQADCGRIIPMGDGQGVAETILEFAEHPELVKQLGANGRAAFFEEYEKDVCCDQWAKLLKEMTGLLAPSTSAPKTTTTPAKQTASRSGDRSIAAMTVISGS